jgi:isoprenylcysteine carboxyl methyltransferase (ICMT) family protein YpbQ
MTISHWLIAALWLLLITYWAIAGINVKASVGRSWLRGCGVRLGLIVLLVLAFRAPILRQGLQAMQAYEAHSPLLRIGGVVLCATGVGLAIFARIHLGRNWGMPASRKEDPELVTTGPYAVVRHPIYTGIILAMLGSMMGAGVYWVLPLVLFGAYFVTSARREEKFMLERFPEQYPAYVQRTKMLLPFIL